MLNKFGIVNQLVLMALKPVLDNDCNEPGRHLSINPGLHLLKATIFVFWLSYGIVLDSNEQVAYYSYIAI